MNNKGFTLIELIVTILLVGIMAAMVVPYFLSGVTTSSKPFDQMPPPLRLQLVMANIITDYSNSGTYLHNLTQLNSNIVVSNSSVYKLNSLYTINTNANYRFNANDINPSLRLTVTDKATGQSLTYIFTQQF
ncbi:MAG: type II secretion system protein [Desulfovibrio sp.]|nr:type II secretion system protein [Desulfovibrio sp.]MBI4958202.1 type II secretion system protein [Desulfovibrio sp.]